MKVVNYNELQKKKSYNKSSILFSRCFNEGPSIFIIMYLLVSSWQKTVFKINVTNLKIRD